MNTIELSPRAASVLLVCLCLCACGGDGGKSSAATPLTTETPMLAPFKDGAVKVGKIAAEIYVQNPAKSHRQALAEQGIAVLSESCFAANPDPLPPGAIDSGLPEPVLYVYEIRRESLSAAVELGFKTDYPAARFKSVQRPCVFDPTPVIVPGKAQPVSEGSPAAESSNN